MGYKDFGRWVVATKRLEYRGSGTSSIEFGEYTIIFEYELPLSAEYDDESEDFAEICDALAQQGEWKCTLNGGYYYGRRNGSMKLIMEIVKYEYDSESE